MNDLTYRVYAVKTKLKKSNYETENHFNAGGPHKDDGSQRTENRTYWAGWCTDLFVGLAQGRQHVQLLEQLRRPAPEG